MRVERAQGHGKKILIGMIVSKAVLARIADKWTKEGLFDSEFENLVGSWCVKFFRKYGDVPGKSIESLFHSWAENGSDKATIRLVEGFLDGLSGEYEQLAEEINAEHIVDFAGEYFSKVAMRRMRDIIDGALEEGNLDLVYSRLNRFGRVELGVGSAIDAFTDQDAVMSAMEEKQESIIHYPGALGEFFGNSLERSGFIAFEAPEKRAKSWWLLDLVYRAATQRRKVAYFQVGDMSQNQIMRRLVIRTIRRPLYHKRYRYPVAMTHEKGSPHATVELDDREVTDEVSWQEAYKVFQEVVSNKIKSKESFLKLSCHPAGTLNVAGMDSILDNWERQFDWTPDVVVVDYADILAPLPGLAETREKINGTWMALASLRLRRHCLVVTATQADAGSYNVDIITRKNFSEDKRKHAHVTGMIGINSSDDEKKVGVYRLNWIQRREEAFLERACVHVAGCLDIGNPAIRSVW